MGADRYAQMIKVFAEMGIPDRKGLFIRGIRKIVAEMFVDRVRAKGRQKVTTSMLAALGLAEMIVLEETPPLPPDPR